MALMNLAQSFRVTNRPGGCFATKVDLYFSQKDFTDGFPIPSIADSNLLFLIVNLIL